MFSTSKPSEPFQASSVDSSKFKRIEQPSLALTQALTSLQSQLEAVQRENRELSSNYAALQTQQSTESELRCHNEQLSIENQELKAQL
jgi:seryl-tRNA synthetase